MGQRFWQYLIVFLVMSAASYAQLLGENAIQSARGKPNSFDFPSGNFVSGTINHAPVAGSTLIVSLKGTLNTIEITTTPLTVVIANMFQFSAGTVSVPTQPPKFGNIALSGGVVIVTAARSVSIGGNLAPYSPFQDGAVSFDFEYNGTSLVQGSAGLEGELATVP